MSYIGQAPGLGQRTAFRFVAVSGQTTFSGPDAQGYPLGYTPGLVDIYLNGRLLSEPDVTASDGSTIKIATSLSAGDEVRVLAQAPFSPANTYTMAQADSFQRRRNRIINPGMRISQEYGSNAVSITAESTAYYPVDGTNVVRRGATGMATAQQVAVATPGGSPNRLRIIPTVANPTPGTQDYLVVQHLLEGLDVSDLALGTAAARPIGIRLGMNWGAAGTVVVNLRNATGATRSYLTTVAIAPGEVGKDVVKTVVIPGDVTGAWATSNAQGLVLTVSMLTGANWQGVTGWQAGNLFGVATQTNFMATAGVAFDLFDLGLYDVTGLQQGVVPPFELESFDADYRKCLRYYFSSYEAGVPPNSNTPLGIFTHVTDGQCNFPTINVEYPVHMRISPSVICYGQTGGSSQVYNQNTTSNLPAFFVNGGVKRIGVAVNNTVVAVNNTITCHIVANARL